MGDFKILEVVDCVILIVIDFKEFCLFCDGVFNGLIDFGDFVSLIGSFDLN